tara:strand:- start:12545 stop:13345 length:801 start_codon:yes stop_codon:yes gene_type:complete
MNHDEENNLRSNIRHMIRHVKQKRLNEEKELRNIIRSLVSHETKLLNEKQTSDVDPTPNKSTGINVLEDLLKKIIPVLQTDYKLLTTDIQQRESFRAHVVKSIVNTLTPVETNNEAGEEAVKDTLDEEVEIDVGETDEEKFIDIRTDAEKTAEEEPEDPREEFGKGLEGEDQTGRNMAYSTVKKVESAIIDSYELLSNEEDQELFYDYLIANVKLYFDKFETELAGQVEEPSNQAYNTAKAEGGDVESAEAPVPEGPTPDEIEFGL